MNEHVNGSADISTRAVQASSTHRQDMRAMELGIGGSALYEALAKATEHLPIVIENTKSGHKSKYAPLDALLTKIKPILQAENLLIRQGHERSHGADDGGTKTRIYPVYTDIIHWPTGQMHRTTIDIPAPRLDAQGVGSAITYGKRYSLLAALGIATNDDVDDDGQSARKREITDDLKESSTLQTLKASIDQIVKKGDITKLREFQVGEAGQKLEEEEFGALRAYWQQAHRTMKDSEGSK